MPPKKTDNFTKIVIVLIVASLIIVTVGAFYFLKSTTVYAVDSSASSINEPYLNGSVTIEVDYMAHCVITQEQLDGVSEVFFGYGINITFILDDEVAYQTGLTDDDISIYYQQYRDEDVDSYILIGSDYIADDNVLGAIYNSRKIIIFKNNIDQAFDGSYAETALLYVLVHEIGHAYGAEHSDEEADIMYPYLSQGKMIVYPDPQFYDLDSREEILN